MTLANLHPVLAAACQAVLADLGLDASNPDSVRGECYTASRALAKAILASEMPQDAWGDALEVEAYEVQLFDAPAAIAGNELAAGHYVTRVGWDGEDIYIDLTAAQFPELGWTGVRVTDYAGW